MDNDIATGTTAQRVNAALSYIQRGWPIVPLHDVAMGYCSCGDTSEKHMSTSAGKHPLAKAWQHAAVADEEIARGLFSGRPDMNFGIKTGLTAGVWVLDVDPKNGGDLRLAELEKEHGALPDTYTVRTGSGGRHHFFALPDDFTPTNSPGSLPTGLDVRGEGGFVVAAPCRSGIGAYEVLLNLPVVGASDWLLDMIRPRVPADIEHRAAMTHWDNPVAVGQSDRLARYAYAAAMAELTELAQCPPGRRGWTAHKVACVLIELTNSPWTGIGEELAKDWFAQAVAQAMAHGGKFDEREAWAAWGTAANKIGARGRAAPGAVAGGVLLGWNQLGGVPPFSPSGLPGNAIGIPGWTFNGVNGTAGTLDGTAVPFAGQTGPMPVPSGPFAENGAENGHDPVAAMISTFLDGRGLSKLPPPEWIIKDWIPKNALVQTVGQPGHGKSFVALDQAMHIALGREWHGRRVCKSRVGYLVAEGANGMGQRYKAWCQRFNDGQDVEGITFIPYPVQAGNHAAWEVFALACHRMGFEYLVIDTQARVTVGMEENSAKEMGMFVDQVENLRRLTGATVNVVHHQNKAGGSARGSGAMLGALHTEITVTRTEDRVTSTVTKQKDAETPVPLVLALVSEKVGERVQAGNLMAAGWAINAEVETIWAGVLIEVDTVNAAEWDRQSNQGRILMILTDIFPMRGATKAEASQQAANRGMKKQSFHGAWDRLEGMGMISKVLVDDRPTGKWIKTPAEDKTPGQ